MDAMATRSEAWSEWEAAGVCGCETCLVGRRAPRPLPSAFRGFSCGVLFIIQNLFGELNVALSAAGAGIVHDDRLAKARSLGEPHTTRNDGLKDLVAKELLEVT